MSSKFFSLAAVSLAVILALLGCFLPPTYIQHFMLITNFFDIMIPVLAVAALIKYLCGDCLED